MSVQYTGEVKVVYNEPPIPGPTGTKAFVDLRANLSWTISAHGTLGGAVTWTIAKLTGSVTVEGANPDGSPLTCSGTFRLDRSHASFQGGIYTAGAGRYTVAPPNGAPFFAIADRSSGSDPACSQDYWNANSTSAWGRFQTYPKGSATKLTWTQASAPSEIFPASGSHTEPIDFSYICNSHAGCQGVEGGPKFYGSSSLALASRLTFSA